MEKDDMIENRGRKMVISLFAFYTLALTVAFATPENILEYTWARWFVDLMSFIPYVAKVGEVSPIPQIAQFTAAVMWLATPLMYVAFHRYMVRISEPPCSSSIKIKQALKLVFVFYVCCPAIVLTLAFLIIGPHALEIETSTRLGIGLLGTINMLAVAVLSASVVWSITNWRSLLYGNFKRLN
jgi:hypothetical protein